MTGLPKGLVSCKRIKPPETIFATPCFCGGRRYTCPRCLRFVPECFGAADELGHLCDDCWNQETGQ